MGKFNINLLSRNETLLDKQYYDSCSQVLPLVKKYMNLCLSHSPHQLIVEPTRTTERTKILIDHILTTISSFIVQEKRHS